MSLISVISVQFVGSKTNLCPIKVNMLKLFLNYFSFCLNDDISAALSEYMWFDIWLVRFGDIPPWSDGHGHWLRHDSQIHREEYMRLHVPLGRFGNIPPWSDDHFGSDQLVVTSGSSVGQLVVTSGSSVGQLVVREVGWPVGDSGGWVASWWWWTLRVRLVMVDTSVKQVTLLDRTRWSMAHMAAHMHIWWHMAPHFVSNSCSLMLSLWRFREGIRRD